VLALFAAITLGLVLHNALELSRRSIGWLFAAAVVAVMINGPVEWLSRWLSRWLAVLLMFLSIGAVAGVVAYGVFSDLSRELDGLEEALPRAARELEASEQFGEFARDLQLETRAQQAVDGLGERLSGEARATAASVGAYFVGTVLVLFLLAWLPRFIERGIAQIGDETRRARAWEVTGQTLGAARRYLSMAVLVALATGMLTYGIARWASLPAPVALGLFVAIFSVVPYVGVMIGSLPAVLLAVGLETSRTALALFVAVCAVQVGAAIVQQRVQHATLYVGPGITLIVGLLGFATYNIGGAVFGVAATVFALALVDALATDEPMPEELDALTIV